MNNLNPFGGRAGNSDRHDQDNEGMTDQGQGASRGNVLFRDEVDEQEYDFADDGVPRGYGQRIPADNSYEGMGSQRGEYAQCTTTNNNYNAESDYEEYESRRQAVFQPRGNPQPNTMGTRPPGVARPARHGATEGGRTGARTGPTKAAQPRAAGSRRPSRS
jgi:hypothetical protein